MVKPPLPHRITTLLRRRAHDPQSESQTCGSWRVVILLPFFTAAGIVVRIRAAAGVSFPAALVIFAVTLAAALVPRSRRTALLLVPICFFAAGSLRAARLFAPGDPGHVANMVRVPAEAAVRGVVVSVDSRGKRQSRFVLECGEIRLDGARPRTCRGRIRLTMYGRLPADIVAGERALVRARLRPAGTIMTPGVNDYRLYLARAGIWTTGRVVKDLVVRLEPDPGAAARPGLSIERWRERARDFIAAHTRAASGAIYRAILTGDTSAIRPDLRRAFVRSGTAHLLAISGMHMAAIFAFALVLATVAGFVHPPLLLRFPRRKLAGALAIPPLAAYALIAGMKPPVFRAAVMTTMFIILLAADRRHSAAAALAMTAALVLLSFPASLLSASFQLSFAAVGVIIMAWNRLARWRTRLAGKRLLLAAAGAVVSGIAAQAGTMPFALAHFNQVSTLSVPATMLLLPLVCFWALPLGLGAMAAAPLFPKAAGLMLAAGAPALDAAAALAGRLAALPAAAIYLPTPSPLLIAAYFAALATAYAASRKRPGVFAAALVVLPATLAAATAAVPPPRPRVVFLDVGKGSATAVFTPAGHTLLIDAGGSSSPRFDPGERIIAPYLFHEGVGRIDMVALTHAHADHTTGLAAIVERFRPRVIWTNGDTGEEELARAMALAAARGCRVRTARAGETLFREKGARLVCLRDSGGRRGNAGSLVLRYEAGGLSVLFPGDLPPAIQQRLAGSGRIPATRVLLAPHHGSPAYFDPALARAAGSGTVVVSTGRSEKIAPEWRAIAPRIEITARDGAIEIAADARGRIRISHPWQGGPAGIRPR